MNYVKKVLVLKQIESGYSINDKHLSGICRIEIEQGVCEIYLTTINILPKENTTYKLVLIDEKRKPVFFDCGKRPCSHNFLMQNLPKIKDGFAVGICAINEEIPITIAFACDENFDLSLGQFKSLVADKCFAERKSIAKASEQTYFPKKTLQEQYDDEAVATANYYNFDEDLEKTLKSVKEKADEFTRLSNEHIDNNSQEKERACSSQNNFFQDEKNLCNGTKFTKEYPFFLTAKNDLENIFDKFEPYEKLSNLFPFSRFAKINYSKDRFYIVGVIKEDDAEKYICYGVPDKYSLSPPKQLKGFCTFIPLSIFDLTGDGFWMMFQDAVTGKCIKPNPPFD